MARAMGAEKGSEPPVARMFSRLRFEACGRCYK